MQTNHTTLPNESNTKQEHNISRPQRWFIKKVVKKAKKKANKAADEKDIERAERYHKQLVETFTGRSERDAGGLCKIFDFTKLVKDPVTKQMEEKVLTREDFEKLTIPELCQKLNDALDELEKMM